MTEDQIEDTLRELLALNHQEFQFEANVVEHASPAFKKYEGEKRTDVANLIIPWFQDSNVPYRLVACDGLGCGQRVSS
jgi:hypothetical protein